VSNRKDRRQNRRTDGEQTASDTAFPCDLELLFASQQTDVLTDRDWFLAHPGVTERDRPASLLERAAQWLPPEARVLVFLLEDGRQGRVFYLPEKGEK
jgi:hypothetical protein